MVAAEEIASGSQCRGQSFSNHWRVDSENFRLDPLLSADYHRDIRNHLPRASSLRGAPEMQCPRCQADNREGRRFCAECGASLALPCSACGFSNEPGEKFCGGCGVPLTSARRTPEPRPSSPQSYMPQTSSRASSRLPRGTGRGAQTGDGAVRRPEGLVGAPRRP